MGTRGNTSSERHSALIDKDGKFFNPSLRVNGKVDLALDRQGGITFDGTRGNGTWHNASPTVIGTWQA